MATAPQISKNPDIDKILIIGPNGNVGKHLIPGLLKLGYQVRALQYRTPVEPKEGLEVVPGCTLDIKPLEQAMDGVQAVCEMIRATGPGKNSFEKWFNCAVAGTANLLEVAKTVDLRRFIAGSADNVFGHITISHYDSITENSPKRFADGYYGLFKIVEEEMCRQYYLGFNIPTVVARFGWIWTEDTLSSMAGNLDRKNEKIIKKIDINGKPLVRHDVHMNDVVQGILLCLEKDEAVGEDFNFLANAPYSSTQLCEILSAKYGWAVEEKETGWHSWTISSEKAKSMLGYRPKVNILDWIKDRLEL